MSLNCLRFVLKWPALLLFSQMADSAMTKRAVENKKNFGTRISTDFHRLLFGDNIVVNFEF